MSYNLGNVPGYKNMILDDNGQFYEQGFWGGRTRIAPTQFLLNYARLRLQRDAPKATASVKNNLGAIYNILAHRFGTKFTGKASDKQQKEQSSDTQLKDSTDKNGDTQLKDKPRRGDDSSGKSQTSPQTPAYNYNFGSYNTVDPNDSSKVVENQYWNADNYSNFKSAFNAAKQGGHGVFTWKGKAYNTMSKGDDAGKFRQNNADYDAFISNAYKGNINGVDNSGGWSNDKNYNPDNVFQQSNPMSLNDAKNDKVQSLTDLDQPTSTPTQIGVLGMNDITGLGFNNYAGMVSAINNSSNASNKFVMAMKERYGADTSKWNQNQIENDLQIKGKYRGRILGDFKDIFRNMSAWTGTRDGKIAKQELADRTGSNGTVYSSKAMRDSFESHPAKNTSTTQTPTWQPTTQNTPSNTYTQSTNTQFNFNQPTSNQNTFSFNSTNNPYLQFGYSGSTKKYQKGGSINMEEQQLQQAFLQYLMQETGAKDQQQLEQVIQQLGEDGLKQAYAQFLQEVQQQQVQAAKFGAKLNYIKRLNGQCPYGSEMAYFKVGGRICKKCVQKQQKEQEDEEPSDPIKAFKCGRKMKKR